MPELTLEQRIEKLEAVNAVQNLVGRYEFLHVANQHRACLDLYALDTPGVKIAMDWGVFSGRAGVERFFLGYHGGHEATDPAAELGGDMHLHTQTTPVIEVADDLQTAKAVFISPGNETIPTGPGGSKEAWWMWAKYRWDFVREHGEWKIWHQYVYCTFMTPYSTSWVDAEPLPPRRRLPADKGPDEYFPSPAPWTYGVDKPHVNIPEPPKPYVTFDEATDEATAAS